jgi:predicted transcriptional regulator
VQPIAYLEELRTLVLEEARGTSLRDRLLEARDPVAATRTVARAVAAFHQDSWAIPRRNTLADHLGQLQRASAILEWACPDLRHEVRAITNSVASRLEEARSAPSHGDLKPDHVFLADGEVIFVDLDSMALGDPARDAAHFCSYVAAGVGLEALPPGTGRRLAREFADEYFAHVPEAWRRQFGLHLAGALIEVACGIFRHQEPWWSEKAEAAVAEARRALDGDAAPAPWPVAAIESRKAVGVGERTVTSARTLRRPAGPSLSSLTGFDLVVMQALWARGEATAFELAQEIDHRPARSTIVRRLVRLEALGAVGRRVAGRQSLYRAMVAQADVRRSFVEDLAGRADELFDGDRAAMVCQLMRACDVEPGDVARLLAMLRGQE